MGDARARRMDADGSNAVEFALVLPVLAMLLFGILTGGLALNQQQQLSHAAREGARYGATLPGLADDDDTAFASVAARTSNSLDGVPIDDEARICITYGTGSTTSARRWYSARTGASASAPADPDAWCPTLISDDTTARVQVSVRNEARLEAVMIRRDVLLSGDAVAVYELAD